MVKNRTRSRLEALTGGGPIPRNLKQFMGLMTKARIIGTGKERKKKKL